MDMTKSGLQQFIIRNTVQLSSGTRGQVRRGHEHEWLTCPAVANNARQVILQLERVRDEGFLSCD